jgi:hypothetical protein
MRASKEGWIGVKNWEGVNAALDWSRRAVDERSRWHETSELNFRHVRLDAEDVDPVVDDDSSSWPS